MSMKANELMIGDLVEDINRDILLIRGLNDTLLYGDMFIGEYLTGVNQGETRDFLDIEDVNPIPLTPEILEKNGFTKEHSCGYYCLRYMQYKDNDGDYDLYICNGIREGSTCEEINEYQFTAMRYVHELQHALRLCGIDKEIVL